MAEIFPETSKQSSVNHIKDVIRELTGPRLIERGFPAELVGRFSRVEYFFNEDGGKQATISLPGQWNRPEHLNVGFDINWDPLGQNGSAHLKLTDDALELKTGEEGWGTYTPLDEEAAQGLADTLSRPETSVSVTMFTEAA